MVQGSQVCKHLAPSLVLLNMAAGGVTPDLSIDEANRLGFKILKFPATSLGPVFEHVSLAMKELKKTRGANISETRVSSVYKETRS
jgi:hypothetical protein